MVENGLYVIKRELLEVINSLGGDCDIVNGNKRQKLKVYIGQFQQATYLIEKTDKKNITRPV